MKVKLVNFGIVIILAGMLLSWKIGGYPIIAGIIVLAIGFLSKKKEVENNANSRTP